MVLLPVIAATEGIAITDTDLVATTVPQLVVTA
jgi:hypothetical protein